MPDQTTPLHSAPVRWHDPEVALGQVRPLSGLACGLAVHTTLPAGRASPHAQAAYRFLRPAPRAALLTCLGEVVHQGRTLAIARAEVTDDDGRLIALGDATHAYVDL